MSFNDNGYFPTFEKAEHPNEGYYVYWRGGRWGLLTPVEPSWDSFNSYGWHPRTSQRVQLKFEMVLLPPDPEPPQFEDHIIRSEN
ncbi:hypothetical protein [Mycobacterium paragordonae]|uniref:Uncharacterized protein n=1 Tax=Mycobacterium paragordonae TaxID=1389713 RepID=A0AAJ1RY36_9MYCO|nr:hypothetical protein [Mycobacterium paragordonae]MDP7733693.1 hypothetical protein [Mycobacterium paragordonae]